MPVGSPLRFAKPTPKARRGAPKARPYSLFRPKTQAVNNKITLERCTPRGRASRRAPTFSRNQRRRPVGARQRHAREPCFVRKHKRLTTKSHSKDVRLAGVPHGAPLRSAKPTPKARRGAPKARPQTLFRPKTQAVNNKITLERCTPRGRASRRAPTFSRNQRRRPVGARQRHAREPCFVRKIRRLTVKSHENNVRLAGVPVGAPLRFVKSMPQSPANSILP